MEEVKDEEVNANIPTTTITNVRVGPPEMRLFGRKIIYDSYKQEDMNEDTIKKILLDVFSVHLNNSLEIDYLENVKADLSIGVNNYENVSKEEFEKTLAKRRTYLHR